MYKYSSIKFMVLVDFQSNDGCLKGGGVVDLFNGNILFKFSKKFSKILSGNVCT